MPSLQPPLVNNKLHGLDHLRALAIIMVFCFHYPESEVFGNFNPFVSFCWSGVDLFFVLSGYLIASQLLKAAKNHGHIPLREFYIKRSLRILPAYFTVVAIYFCIPAFSEQGKALPPLWKFLTFTQNLGLTGGKFSHAWSLCVEEQFYIFFPMLLLLLLATKNIKKWIFPCLLILFAFTCLFRLYLWNMHMEPIIKSGTGIYLFWVQWIYYLTPSRLDGLLAGIAIAALTVFLPATWKKISRYGNLLLLAGICLLIAAYFLTQERISFNGTVYGFPLVAIGYGVLVMAALCPSCILYKFSTKITATLATLSYSLYLIHKGMMHLCIDFFDKKDMDTSSWKVLLTSAVASLLAALLLRYIIEKPFLKLRDKLLRGTESKPSGIKDRA